MIKNYKIVFVLPVFLVFVNICFSQGKEMPFNLSLAYPVSMNRSVEDNVQFSVGIIGSRFNTLKVFGVNTIYSILEKDMHGFQVNGLYGETRGKLNGLQLTGGANVITEGGSGAMVSGVGNLSFDNFSGLQLSGLSNIGFESVKGLQIAGLYNLAGLDISVMQIAIAGNVAGRFMNGAQVSALFNIAGNLNGGLQLGGFNLTNHQKGAQLGLINISNNNTGFQLGILNMVGKKQNGTSLGLFYVFDDTKVQLMMSGGNISYGTLGVRFKTNKIYSMLDIGAPVAISKSEKSVLFSYRVGYAFDLNYLNFNSDIGFSNISSESNQTEGKPSKNQFGLSVRFGFEKDIFKKLGVFLNMGYMKLSDSYDNPAFKNNFIFEGGIVVL